MFCTIKMNILSIHTAFRICQLFSGKEKQINPIVFIPRVFFCTDYISRYRAFIILCKQHFEPLYFILNCIILKCSMKSRTVLFRWLSDVNVFAFTSCWLVVQSENKCEVHYTVSQLLCQN